MNSKLPAFGGGVVLGLLLALGGGYALKDKLIPPPQVKVVTVEKIVEKEKIVKVPVTVEKKTSRLYRASLVDEKGNVTQSWDVTKCKFIVIGATLTDRSGKTFEVRGRIKIEPIK